MTARRRYLRNEDVELNVGRVLSTLAQAEGIRLSDVAEALGMHRNALSDRVCGRRRFTVAELAAAADFFGVHPGIFFEDARRPR